MTWEKKASQVKYLAAHFWLAHKKLLESFGQTQEDTEQEAWMIYWKMLTVWPTNPTKYILPRLMDWMRGLTHCKRGPSRYVQPTILFWEHVPEGHYTPSFDFPDVLRCIARHTSPREAFIVARQLEGYTNTEIAQMLKISGGRVSQLQKGMVKRMRKVFQNGVMALALALLSWWPVPAWSQTIISSCTGVSWDANTEADLAGYKIYVEKDGVAQTPVDVGPTETTFPCAGLPMTEGGSYALSMKAYDTSGNMSLPSTPVLVDWPDVTPPNAITSICWDVVEIVVDSETGKVLSSTPKQICE